MYDDVAALRITLEADGFDRFETACLHDESSVRTLLLDTTGVEEALVVRTCQRYELYAAGPRATDELQDLVTKIQLESNSIERLLTGEDVVEHLFRVACGLESGVLGEDEILGQVKEAYREASETDALGGTLDTIALKALRTGERARTETAINEGAVSLGSIAAERAREELDTVVDADNPLSETHALIVGAGDVSRQVLKALTHRNVGTVTVANRTESKAEKLAEAVDGRALSLADLDTECYQQAELLVTATGANDRLFSIADLVGHELVVVDLANPRDVDPAVADLEDVHLVSIDEVLSVRNEGLERREAAVSDVEALIEEELARLGEQLRAERVDGALNQIYSRTHDLRTSEFERALERLEIEDEPLSDTQRQVMEDFSEALVNKLLHPKTTALRQAAARDDREMLDAWLTLFDQRSAGRDDDEETTPERSTSMQS